MAQASKRVRRERRQRRELNQTRRILTTYQLQEQYNGLLKDIEQVRKQLFMADRLLVAVLAQNGDQEVTHGTMQEAVDDLTISYRTRPKEGAENVMVVSLHRPEEATANAILPTGATVEFGRPNAPAEATEVALDPA